MVFKPDTACCDANNCKDNNAKALNDFGERLGRKDLNKNCGSFKEYCEQAPQLFDVCPVTCDTCARAKAQEEAANAPKCDENCEGAECIDNDQMVVEGAKARGMDLSGCIDLKGQCAVEQIKNICRKTCEGCTGDPAAPAPAPA